MPIGVGAAILGSSIIGGGLSSLGQFSANSSNLKIARENRQWNLEQWNRENAYNTPQAQMQRYVDAGLNPNLIYGSGSASSGNAGAVPSSPIPHVESVTKGIDPSTFMSMLSAYQQIKQSEATVDLTQKNADLVTQKTINEAILSNTLKSTAGIKSLEFEKNSRLLNTQVSTSEENLRKLQNVNKDIMYKINSLNPANLRRVDLSNAESVQRINELNPALMQLRQVETQLKRLDYDMNSGLKPYGVTSSDNVLLRMILKAFAGNKEEFNPYDY